VAGERLRALAVAVGDAIAKSEGLVVRLEEVLDNLGEAADQRLEELKSGLAHLSERFTDLEVAIEEDEPAPEA
jgi:hypothetical protein